jgi:UDP:flavonoid glycosyltransferase YjiC (YdhE family)
VRVLFTSTPAVGHVHPMVPLARAFRDDGDRVGWATGAELCSQLGGEGFEAMPAGLGAEESRREFYRRFPEYWSLPQADGPAFMFPRLFGSVRAPRMLADLLICVREWKPDLIVHDAAEFAGAIAAAVAAVPAVTHSFGGLTPADAVAAASREVAPLWEASGLQPRPYAGSYDSLYLDIYPESLRSGRWDHVPFVQFLRPDGFALPGSEPLPSWLGDDVALPVVYVTFGTVFNRDIARLTTVISALHGLPIQVIVTVGPAGDPAAVGAQPANVHVARYLRQSDLLPACTAVISHAGSGTLLATLAAGLPQLCLPQAADQFRNAAACARAGAGILVQPEDITTGIVRDATTRLLAETSFRERARQLAREIAGMPRSSAVAGIIRTRHMQ